MENKELFEKNGYVHLKNFLVKENCAKAVLELKDIIAQGKTSPDTQCPLSQAVHGAPIFDRLLEQLVPHFEAATGKKLFPTFAYARLYDINGEELLVHVDRAACEISATVTLGFEGDVWPIYMGPNEDKAEATEIKMDIGDVVLYKGMDVWHWREKYTEGKWQAQVFLHYVDQEGPHAEWKYDKRPSLSYQTPDTRLGNFYSIENVLPLDVCDMVVKECSKDELKNSLPVIGNAAIESNLKNVERVSLPINQGIGGTLTSFGLNLNHQMYKYNITHSSQTDFLMYTPGSQYLSHVDVVHTHAEDVKKLSVVMFLNDDCEGGRFFIQTSGQKIYPPQKKGSIIIFPSFQLYGVEEVTKGNKYVVITWLMGPYFK